MYVLAGEGRTLTPNGSYPVRQGDTILVPADEPHVTRNTGTVPLVLLCFFPNPDVAKSTEDLPLDLENDRHADRTGRVSAAGSRFCPRRCHAASFAVGALIARPPIRRCLAISRPRGGWSFRRSGRSCRPGCSRKPRSRWCRSPAPVSTASIRPAVKPADIPVANIPGGSNNAIAEYVGCTTASVLLRRLAWADAEIKAGCYAEWRARMIADNLGGLENALVGIVGAGRDRACGGAAGRARRLPGLLLRSGFAQRRHRGRIAGETGRPR